MDGRAAVIFGSLFSGIGGIDLGLERAGMRCLWQVEIDRYCRGVLREHWPDVQRFRDVRKLRNLPYVDLIAGGFPCQPVSLAGKRLAQDDPRWLWPEFARVVRMVRPAYVFVENVPGLLSRGMSDVLGDLAALGFDAEWRVLSAADVGAPHLRKRVFILGYRRELGPPGSVSDTERDELRIERQREREQCLESRQALARDDGEKEPLADTDGGRREVERFAEHGREQSASGRVPDRCGAERWWDGPASADVAPPQSDVGRTPHGVPAWMDGPDVAMGADGSVWANGWEQDIDRLVRKAPKRAARLRALGNAVVPQVAEWIGRRIMEANS